MSISSTSLAAPIFGMAPIKNGTLAVAGGGSSKTGIVNSLTKICVEETAGGKFELGKCQKHSLGSTCLFSVAASADSTRIVGGAQEFAVVYSYISDQDQLSEIVRFPADFAGKSPEVNAVAFGLESTCILTGGSDGILRVWRVPGDVTRSTPPTLLLECKGHTGAIQSVAVDPVNGLAATGSSDGSARVWYLPVLMGGAPDDRSAFCWQLPAVAPGFITKPAAPRGGRKQRHKSAGAFKYANVAFSGSTLVTLEASEFGGSYVALWELEKAGSGAPCQVEASSCAQLAISAPNTAALRAAVPAPPGEAAGGGDEARETIVAGSHASKAVAGPSRTPNAELQGWTWCLGQGRVATPGPACALGLASDGSGLLVSCSDKVVYEYTMPNLVQRNKYRTGHSFAPLGVAYTPDCEHFVTGSPDHSVALFKRGTSMSICAAAVMLLVFMFFSVVIVAFIVVLVNASLAAGDGSFASPLPEHFSAAAVSLQGTIKGLFV